MYTTSEQKILLQYASQSINFGLRHKIKLEVNKNNFPVSLFEKRASFVTLHLDNNLRGCIGTLNAHKPLLEDVIDNAYAAAFEDPRFQNLTQDQFQNTEIEISVLSIPEKLNFTTELDLLSQLRIGIDGIIFEYQQYRATYLPSVWSSFLSAQLFINSLKEKAGVDANFWSNDICCYRYTTELIE